MTSPERRASITPKPGGEDPAALGLTDTDLASKTLVGVSADVGLADSPVVAGEKVGKYEIRALLGKGGMGAVYLAFDPLIEREVALKVLTSDLGNAPSALQRFLGEARAIGRLNHPHVVSIYDIDLWSGKYYLVMELLSGGSVADRIDGNEGLPWPEACRITAEAARGLAAAHAAGMIHRDIKPENLMLTRDGLVKVVDFGLSKLLDASHDPQHAVTKAGQILGTPQYMSPEQFESAEVDALTDVYSLGATLFRLLTARFPYHDCSSIMQVMTSHLTKPPPVPSAFVPSLPADCDRIVARAMAKNRADRYPSIQDMADDLQKLIDGGARPSVDVGRRITIDDRPMSSVLIVEPSRLQGAVLKDAFSHAGAKSVRLASTIEQAREAVAQEPPDVIATAMELSDGRGIALLQELCRRPELAQSAAILHSSDSTMEELAAVRSSGTLILAPKKIRPDEVLRVVHATGPCVAQSGPLTAPLDPSAVRLRIVMDQGRIPDVLADLIRELRLLDVEVLTRSDRAIAELRSDDLVLRLVPTTPGGESGAAAAQALEGVAPAATVAAISLEQRSLLLRAVRRSGVVAVCHRPLNAARLICLFQCSRS